MFPDGMKSIYARGKKMSNRVTYILAGGRLSLPFLKEQLDRHSDRTIIAADRGLEACVSLGIEPDFVIGDFDSLDETIREEFLSQEKNVTKLNPIKDDTDTEAALTLAFEKTEGDIIILGGTGTRLDHVLGNIGILGQGFAHGRSVELLDEHNRIRLADGPVTIKKREQYGKYVSLLPLTTEVKGVTLEGFYYPLHEFTLTSYTSIGISNEIVEEEARISFDEGVLVIIESKD